MSDNSAIQWTDATWNPTTGCTKVSPGCAKCYIERTPPFRIHGRKFVNGHIPLELHENRLDAPLHWKKPRRVFVNSLSDLFHADVPDTFIDQVFGVMAHCPQHTFQLLTKRAERMRAYLSTDKARLLDRLDAATDDFTHGTIEYWPLPNVWLGVSVENQHFADERIPLLLQTPAAVRFISAEPLLGPIDFSMNPSGQVLDSCDECGHRRPNPECDACLDAPPALDWVIVGGESGPRSRPFDTDAALKVVQQCQAANVPVFVKQLGANPWVRTAKGYHAGVRAWPYNVRYHLTDKKGGDITEWPEELRVREFPTRAA